MLGCPNTWVEPKALEKHPLRGCLGIVFDVLDEHREDRRLHELMPANTTDDFLCVFFLEYRTAICSQVFLLFVDVSLAKRKVLRVRDMPRLWFRLENAFLQ